MTLAEKLDFAIVHQQAEVDRLEAVARVDLPNARTKLQRLQALYQRVTPELEQAYVTFKVAGIRLDD